MSTGRAVLATVLLTTAVLCLSLMLYSRLTGDFRNVSFLLSALAFLLASFLIMHGGVEGTGAYFAFAIVIIMVMAGFTNIRVTMSICGLFLVAVAMGLFGSVSQHWVYPYSFVEKVLILVALAALMLLAIVSEWIRLRSYSATVDIHEQVCVDARHDALTKLLNRRGLEGALAALPPPRFPASLAILDLDHFKAVNDTHGHDAGDRAISAFARHLRSSVRAQDIVCRWGGEEFVLVITDAQCAEALAIVDDIRMDFARTTLPIGDNGLRLTFSAGLASLESAGAFERALADADQSLYRAKNDGRNHLQVAEADEMPLHSDDDTPPSGSAVVPSNLAAKPPNIIPV